MPRLTRDCCTSAKLALPCMGQVHRSACCNAWVRARRPCSVAAAQISMHAACMLQEYRAVGAGEQGPVCDEKVLPPRGSAFATDGCMQGSCGWLPGR